MSASILQSVGDSRSPMKYLILASVTNVVLDLLFVAVLRLGVGSAALATIISQILSALSGTGPALPHQPELPHPLGGGYGLKGPCSGRWSPLASPRGCRIRTLR